MYISIALPSPIIMPNYYGYLGYGNILVISCCTMSTGYTDKKEILKLVNLSYKVTYIIIRSLFMQRFAVKSMSQDTVT